MSALPFKGFQKIPRLKGGAGICVTEKIDGTNAQVLVRPLTAPVNGDSLPVVLVEPGFDTVVGDLVIRAGSRNLWLPSGGGKEDNYGFGGWVSDNAEELAKLGHGAHFGEWWGRGIGRNYGMLDRKFSLFNVHRWNDENPNRPACCSVVPVLANGVSFEAIPGILDDLRQNGSKAYPYMNPEGIVVYHYASRSYFKVTLDNDDLPKGLVEQMRKG